MGAVLAMTQCPYLGGFGEFDGEWGPKRDRGPVRRNPHNRFARRMAHNCRAHEKSLAHPKLPEIMVIMRGGAHVAALVTARGRTSDPSRLFAC